MAKALKIVPTEESELYVPRIRALVERGRIQEARILVKEALLMNPTESELSRWNEVLSPAITKPIPELDIDRSADFRWLETHADSYQDQWVAVLGGSLVAHASTLRDLEAILDEKAPGEPVLLHRFH